MTEPRYLPAECLAVGDAFTMDRNAYRVTGKPRRLTGSGQVLVRCDYRTRHGATGSTNVRLHARRAVEVER